MAKFMDTKHGKGGEMDDKERLNALDVAINNEMRERAFYLNHAGATRNPLGKAIFAQLADEELEHAERLKQIHERWEKADKWPETLPLKVKDTAVKNILVDLVTRSKDMAPGDSTDLEAVRTAIQFEEKGAKYYADLRDAVTNPKEKEFFDLLAMIENEHYLSLRNAEEYLSDPESWYRHMEHHTFDGG
jgi:rubrerythrin